MDTLLFLAYLFSVVAITGLIALAIVYNKEDLADKTIAIMSRLLGNLFPKK